MRAGKGVGRRWRGLVAHIVCVLVLGVVLPATAGPAVPHNIATAAGSAPSSPRKLVTGWLPYWSIGTSTSIVTANADLFTDASPFWFSLVRSGTDAIISSTWISSGTHASNIAAMKAAGVPVLPTISDGTGSWFLAGVMADPARSDRLVAAVVRQVTSEGYDGIDLDFEQFAFADGSSSWPTTRVAWVSFVHKLGAALHAAGKLLAVSSPPIYNSAHDYTSGYWVYDWAGISSSIDRLRIMTYDYSYSQAGPIAPLPWVTSVAQFAVTQVASAKVQIGVAAYGHAWVTAVTGTCPSGTNLARLEMSSAYGPTFAASVGQIPRWDTATAERTFSWTTTVGTGATTCRVARTAWYGDGDSARARATLVDLLHLGGIAIWSVDGAASTTWSGLRSYAVSIAPKPVTVQLSAPAWLWAGSAAVLPVTVRTAAGPQVGLAATLWRRDVASTVWRQLSVATTDSAGVANLAISATTTPGNYVVTTGGGVNAAPGESVPVTLLVRIGVTVAPSTNAIQYGASVTVNGQLVPAAARTLWVQQLVAGVWTTIATSQSLTTGAYSTVVRPLLGSPSWLRVVALGDTSINAGWTNSAPMTVVNPPSQVVSLTLTPTTAAFGTPVTAYGWVNPSRVGETVVVQQYIYGTGQWRTVSIFYARATSTAPITYFTVNVTPDHRGPVGYRAIVGPGITILGGVSLMRYVMVP